MKVKKDWKKAWNEGSQENYPIYICQNTQQMYMYKYRVVFLHLKLCFFTFFMSIPTWNEALQILFSCFSTLLCGNFQIKYKHVYCAGDEFGIGDERIWPWRWTLSLKNTSPGDEPTRWKRTFELYSHTHTQIATSDFQTGLKLKLLLLAGTHFRKRAVLRSRNHLRVRYARKR